MLIIPSFYRVKNLNSKSEELSTEIMALIAALNEADDDRSISS